MTDMKPTPRPNADTKPFWEACNDGKLLFQRCNSCGEPQFYPRAVCTKCESRDLAWQESDGRGTVHTFTIVQRAPSAAFKADGPYVLALIDLDEGFRMMVNIVDCDPGAVSIGAPVEIAFEDRSGQAIPQARLQD